MARFVWRTGRSLRGQIMFGHSIVVGLLIAGFISSLTVVNLVSANYTRTVSVDDALATQILLRTKLMDDEETGLRGYLLTHDQAFLRPYRKAAAALPAIRQSGQSLARSEPGSSQLLATTVASATRWEVWAWKTVGIGRTKAHPSTLIARQRQGKRLFDAYRRHSETALAFVTGVRRQHLDRNSRLLHDVTVGLPVVLLVALFVIAFVARYNVRSVAAPLERLSRTSVRIGQGNLDRPVAAEATLEFGNLSKSMDTMRRHLKSQAELASTIGSTLDVSEIYEKFADLLLEIVRYDRLSLTLLDSLTGELVTAFALGSVGGAIPTGTRRKVEKTVISRVLLTHECVIRSDLSLPSEDELFEDELAIRRAGIRSLAMVPLLANGQIIGTLNLGSKHSNVFTPENLGHVRSLAPLLASSLDNARLHAKLRDAVQELERLNQASRAEARRDALTGLGNRLRLDEDLVKLHMQARDAHVTYSLILCDVDHFKAYNDRYGHIAGDGVLCAMAERLLNGVRHSDDVYRYGGEEFLIMLPEGDGASTMAVAQRLLAAVQTPRIPHEAREQPHIVTMSFGIAVFQPETSRTAQDVLEEADSMLYRAKNTGRNRIVDIGWKRREAAPISA